MKTFTYGDPEARVVLIQMVSDHGVERLEAEVAEIKKLSSVEFCLIGVEVSDWNADLSPWPAPAVFGDGDFGDGAADMLAEVLKICVDQEKTYIIGGYSLAGLFALWSACRTDVFRAVAAASPSAWFPGFLEYMGEHEVCAGHVYLSLGKKEEKVRDQVLATVGDRIREMHDLLKARGVDVILEWNSGNHFKDTDVRMAKAFAWTMGRCPE